MIVELLAVLLGGGLAFALYNGLALKQRRPRMQLPDVDDDHVKSHHSLPFGPAVLETKAPRHVVTIANSTGRTGEVGGQWVATATVPLASKRASFTVQRRTRLSASRVGAIAVDDACDAHYTVDGDDGDVVRAWFTDRTIAAALDALFDDRAPVNVTLERSGAFVARWAQAGQGDDDVARAHRLVLACATFLEALEARADAAPVSKDAARLAQKAGPSSTGAPVAVPIGRGRT